MKTAMQELIEHLDIEMKQKGIIPNWDMYLEKENKQIMDSWKEGTKYVMDVNDGKLISPMSAIDYLIYFKTEKSDYYTSFSF